MSDVRMRVRQEKVKKEMKCSETSKSEMNKRIFMKKKNTKRGREDLNKDKDAEEQRGRMERRRAKLCKTR